MQSFLRKIAVINGGKTMEFHLCNLREKRQNIDVLQFYKVLLEWIVIINKKNATVLFPT